MQRFSFLWGKKWRGKGEMGNIGYKFQADRKRVWISTEGNDPNEMDGILQHRKRGVILASLWRGLGASRSTALTCSLVLLWITSVLSCCIQVDCLRGMQFFRKADSAGAQGDFKLEWTQWLESDWLPSSCEAGTIRLGEEKEFYGQGVVHRCQLYHQALWGGLYSLNQAKWWQPEGPIGRLLKQKMPHRAVIEICVSFLKGNNSQFLGAKFCFTELLISVFCGCSIFTFLPYDNITRKPIPH